MPTRITFLHLKSRWMTPASCAAPRPDANCWMIGSVAPAMKKDKLVDLYCEKMGVERHVHGEVAVDKTSIKQSIRALKKQRDAALEAKDLKKLAEIRHAIHKQRHLLRRAVREAEIAALRHA